jgi:hypothetical protein
MPSVRKLPIQLQIHFGRAFDTELGPNHFRAKEHSIHNAYGRKAVIWGFYPSTLNHHGNCHYPAAHRTDLTQGYSARHVRKQILIALSRAGLSPEHRHDLQWAGAVERFDIKGDPPHCKNGWMIAQLRGIPWAVFGSVEHEFCSSWAPSLAHANPLQLRSSAIWVPGGVHRKWHNHSLGCANDG